MKEPDLIEVIEFVLRRELSPFETQVIEWLEKEEGRGSKQERKAKEEDEKAPGLLIFDDPKEPGGVSELVKAFYEEGMPSPPRADCRDPGDDLSRPGDQAQDRGAGDDGGRGVNPLGPCSCERCMDARIKKLKEKDVEKKRGKAFLDDLDCQARFFNVVDCATGETKYRIERETCDCFKCTGIRNRGGNS